MSENKKKFIRPEMTVEELQKALYQSNIKLMESEKKRTEIFSNISHDLRSPLAAIQSTVEYMASDPDMSKEDYVNALSILTRKTEQLGKLIDDLFLLTKYDQGKETCNLSKQDLGPLLEELFYQYEADHTFKDRKLILDVPIDLNANVYLDVDQFRRLMDNLFQNARKYSSDGDSITLSATIENNEVIITLSDTGVGIAPEFIDKIFDRTYTISSARTPGTSGCGLGLAIVKSIVNLHNGKIWCNSTPGIGSHFHIALALIQ